jgi:hypothetical protein
MDLQLLEQPQSSAAYPVDLAEIAEDQANELLCDEDYMYNTKKINISYHHYRFYFWIHFKIT